MGSLKTFIKSVRNSKTIAAERAVIRKESAKIRSSFRDVHLDNDKRRKNIQKLLYLYILGEPTYFGQVECLKLLASPRFADKRVGYMATMLILDESQDILTLLTNSLDIDMKSSNQFIVGLALCTLGNIASPELAKDLYPDVEKLLSYQQPYIKKKAVLVAAKLIEKDPMLTEVYLPYVSDLLNDKSHGVLLGTCCLIDSTYYHDETSHQQLKQLVPKLLAQIKLLTTTGYSPEYDVKGIPDPFLIVSLLKSLRTILQHDTDSQHLESLNDLLTQVCANFENTKGAGCAILYETVKTIFAINSDSSLKVLGINILSKFLTQKDNNIRYVALDTLLQVIEFEPLAVQRHRATIVGCLHDGDISIRRRALELTFGIMNQQNIKLLTKELLRYLAKEDDEELKSYITTQLSISCDKYNANLEWTLETMISMLNIAGNYCNDTILSSILAMIMQVGNKSLTKKILTDMITTLRGGLFDQYGLCLVTVWCLGEFADLVIGSNDSGITEDAIVELINSILAVANYSAEQQKIQMKIYILTTCLKLSVKLKKASLIEQLRQIINSSTSDMNLEIQTRAIEYAKIFGEPMSIKRGLLERMPAPNVRKHESMSLLNRSHNVIPGSSTNGGGSKTGDLLLDLLGDDLSGNATSGNNAKKDKEKESAIDLLSDIFGGSSLNNNNTVEQKNGSILGLFDNNTNTGEGQSSAASGRSGANGINTDSSLASIAARVSEPASVEGFNDGVIRVGFIEKAVGNGVADLEAIVKNVNTKGATISGISVLCAVPKHQKLQLSSISKTVLASQDFTVLNVKITGNPGSKVKIRVKLSYVLEGAKTDRQFDFAGVKAVL